MNEDIIESNHWHFLPFQQKKKHRLTLENPDTVTDYPVYCLVNNNLDIFNHTPVKPLMGPENKTAEFHFKMVY